MQTNTFRYWQTKERNRRIDSEQEGGFVNTSLSKQRSTTRLETTNPTNAQHRQDETWPIDIDFVRTNLGSLMDALLPELIETFFDDGISRLEKLQISLSCHDEQQIWQTAHSLKGSSATIGMLSFSGLCLQLETVAKSKDWENIPVLVAQIHTEFNQIHTVLSV